MLRNRNVTPRTVLCVNAHIYNQACANEALNEHLEEARVVAADGMSIVLAARLLLGEAVHERCNMTEAFRAFLQAEDMPPTKTVVLGVGLDEVQRASRTIESLSSHCHVVKSACGYISDDDYVSMLHNHHDADLILVGMGTPKTERVCSLAQKACPQAVVWGIGGGTLKILAGTMKEAPMLMRRFGMQWLHRLCLNPVNMWKRYLIGNLLFLIHVAIVAWRRAAIVLPWHPRQHV